MFFHEHAFSQNCSDYDGDGFGSPGNELCAGGSATDCNDGDASINPGVSEGCDGSDNNCDGNIDEGFADTDGDGTANCVDYDTVTIPDNNLNDAIKQTLGLTTDPSQADMFNLTFLEAASKGIEDIAGLEYAINLSYLELYDNLIDNISVLSGLTNMNYLYLYNNLINDVSALSGLVNLTDLELDGNSITDISLLSDLTGLEILYLGYNRISDVSVLSGLINLVFLDLYDNLITDVSPLSALNSLEILYLGHNRISDVSSLSGLIDLTDLDLSFNRISSISACSGMDELTTLFLDDNCIADFAPVSHVPYVSGADSQGPDSDRDGICDAYDMCVDVDADGYGNPGAPSCPGGPSIDCNDDNEEINPGEVEVCDDIDNNCDGDIDEGLAAASWYRDADGDNYGNPSIWQEKCNQPAGGWTANNADCNDGDANIYPGGPEIRISSPLAYYSITQLQTAYDAASDAAVVRSKVAAYTGDLLFNQNKTVTLQGGYDCGFANVTSSTTVNGTITVSNGRVTIGNINIQ